MADRFEERVMDSFLDRVEKRHTSALLKTAQRRTLPRAKPITSFPAILVCKLTDLLRKGRKIRISPESVLLLFFVH